MAATGILIRSSGTKQEHLRGAGMKKFDSEIFADYPQVINGMPDSFTSHQFILKLAQRNQKAYIEALYAYRESSGPFRALHIQLAKQLNEHPTLVRQERESPSLDIFNDDSQCMTWSKVGR